MGMAKEELARRTTRDLKGQGLDQLVEELMMLLETRTVL
jgi:hypothetical protein